MDKETTGSAETFYLFHGPPYFGRTLAGLTEMLAMESGVEGWKRFTPHLPMSLLPLLLLPLPPSLLPSFLPSIPTGVSPTCQECPQWIQACFLPSPSSHVHPQWPHLYSHLTDRATEASLHDLGQAAQRSEVDEGLRPSCLTSGSALSQRAACRN